MPNEPNSPFVFNVVAPIAMPEQCRQTRKRGLGLMIAALAVALGCQSGDPGPAGNRLDLDSLYEPYLKLRGDLHLHSSTGSFDSRSCGPGCQTFSAAEQLTAAKDAGLDFAALTEHDRNPNDSASRMTPAQWTAALDAVAQANTAGFVALAGYEWTSGQHSCFETARPQPDFNHKVVILPPGSSERCDSDVCVTPDQLGEFVHKAEGIILTPHPWRVSLLEGAGPPAFVTRDYFTYQGDGPGNVFSAAEVGPDFQPLAWKVLCGEPDRNINSQTATLAEWKQALVQGKRLAAVAASDRHFGFTPFTSRTTVLFTAGRNPAAVLEALQARRSMAVHLEPFDVRFAIEGAIVGGTAVNPSEGTVRVTAPAAEIESIEVWKGDELLEGFNSEAANRDIPVPLKGRGPGAVWVKVTGVELDPAAGTPRTTITSPIWIEVR